MTNIGQSPATHAKANGKYQKTIRVQAHPDKLSDALITPAWRTDATGSGDTGGELRFSFDPPEPCVMHVDQATRPFPVRWTVTSRDFLSDRVDTRPTFTITPVAGDVEIGRGMPRGSSADNARRSQERV